jgi:hypothetical protein
VAGSTAQLVAREAWLMEREGDRTVPVSHPLGGGVLVVPPTVEQDVLVWDPLALSIRLDLRCRLPLYNGMLVRRWASEVHGILVIART